MALTIFLSIFAVCLATLVKADGSLKVGEFTKDSKVLYHGNFEAMGFFFIKRTDVFDVKVTDGGKIKAIDIQDKRGDSSSWILAGGVDEDFVTIKLESKRGYGFQFVIDIYGYNDDEQPGDNKKDGSNEDESKDKESKDSKEDSSSQDKSKDSESGQIYLPFPSQETGVDDSGSKEYMENEISAEKTKDKSEEEKTKENEGKSDEQIDFNNADDHKYNDYINFNETPGEDNKHEEEDKKQSEEKSTETYFNNEKQSNDVQYESQDFGEDKKEHTTWEQKENESGEKNKEAEGVSNAEQKPNDFMNNGANNAAAEENKDSEEGMKEENEPKTKEEDN